eukprot:CAMPEP_0172437214 /NCGR_PEP_ID=MMETSP1064-20121228/72135_1 /TAXON_ID=202472 /ORGANISM="Aulacoseira subarctica , Strain CCAP 1002/5" /LENGTH=547 /DNA_ID=CAMNT_0013185665 /DNA_START=57 /DNA_END=1700 /DNA_ORIENTATION=+
MNKVEKDEKDIIITSLLAEIDQLKDATRVYFASTFSHDVGSHATWVIPECGAPARFAKEAIVQAHELDNKPRLNTSSYVNVVREPEESDIALLGLSVNLADASIYPASVGIHDLVVNMIAKLWNCPEPDGGVKPTVSTFSSIVSTLDSKQHIGNNYSGAGTVGSTEACLLAGLALKFRWRKWYAAKHGLTAEQVVSVVANIVISSVYQAAWEKFFRYFDVQPRFAKPKLSNKMRMEPSSCLYDLCDEKTIAVVGILGNHYNGAYDPVWEINDVIEKINMENGYQIGIHIDAASGGFVAPFQENMPVFDFRLKNVLSISASGHKFGESTCGTGWLVFRHREDLAEHIAVSVTYLGDKCDSMTLNFSRPATAAFVQYYKLIRLGKSGYKKKVQQQMDVAKFIRGSLEAMTYHGIPCFEIVDAGGDNCLPVVAARMNPMLRFKFNSIDLQHALSEYHWYVSGYSLEFEDFSKGSTGAISPLCSDEPETSTMFRVVVKSNLTMTLAVNLVKRIQQVMLQLEKTKGTYEYHSFKSVIQAVVAQNRIKSHSAC